MLNAVKSALCGRVGSPAAKKIFFGFTVVCLMLGTALYSAEMDCPQGEMPCQQDGMQQPQGKMQNKTGMKYGKAGGEKELGKIKMYLKLKDKLELTDEQQKTLEQIQLDYKKDNIKRQADIKLICVDLKGVFSKDAPDFAAARSNIKKVSALQLDSKLAAIDVHEKAYKVLTAKQSKKYSELKKERKGKGMKGKKGKESKEE